ncbi:MAG: replication initiation protein [Cytophagales bacterium]|nr:replication initiation protein [Cytophagales bacterium]
MKRLSLEKLGNYKIVKSNKVVNSRQPFSATQQRIIALMCARIQHGDQDFFTYDIPIHEIIGSDREIVGGADYKRVKEAAQELAESAIHIEEEDRWASYSFITMAKGQKGKGFITVRFSSDMKPFLLGLKEKYTSYLLKNVNRFKRQYSIRIYELCKQYYPNIRTRELSLDVLRNILCLESKYPKFENLRRYVIEPSLKEINSFSDIQVGVEKIKLGRKVVAIKFIIQKNEKYVVPEPEVIDTTFEPISDPAALALNAGEASPQLHADEKVSGLIGGFLSATKYNRFIKTYEKGLVDFVIERINEKGDGIKNKGGYLFKCLKEGYYNTEYGAQIMAREQQQRKVQMHQEELRLKNLYKRIPKEWDAVRNQIFSKYDEMTVAEEALYVLDEAENVVSVKFMEELEELISEKDALSARLDEQINFRAEFNKLRTIYIKEHNSKDYEILEAGVAGYAKSTYGLKEYKG